MFSLVFKDNNTSFRAEWFLLPSQCLLRKMLKTLLNEDGSKFKWHFEIRYVYITPTAVVWVSDKLERFLADLDFLISVDRPLDRSDTTSA